jgi:hypothetical protein
VNHLHMLHTVCSSRPQELMEEEVVSASHTDANLSSPPMRGDVSAPMQLVSVIAEPW